MGYKLEDKLGGKLGGRRSTLPHFHNNISFSSIHTTFIHSFIAPERAVGSHRGRHVLEGAGQCPGGIQSYSPPLVSGK